VNLEKEKDMTKDNTPSPMSRADIEAFEIARADARVQALWDTRQAALELSRRQRMPKAAKGITPKAWAIIGAGSIGLWAFAILCPPALVVLWIAYFILTAVALRWDSEFA
jgi:hypothetical protein